jgi:hypothetical protein
LIAGFGITKNPFTSHPCLGNQPWSKMIKIKNDFHNPDLNLLGSSVGSLIKGKIFITFLIIFASLKTSVHTAKEP